MHPPLTHLPDHRPRGRRRRLIGVAVTTALTALTLAASASGGVTTYTNPQPVITPDEGPADVYPSPIVVDGQSGRVTDVTVKLNDAFFGTTSDADLLLVAPDGQRSIVMSDVCEGTSGNRDFEFNQDVAQRMNRDGPCEPGRYRPSDVTGGSPDDWPGVNTVGVTADFDRFVGGSPNGVWKLYVVDGQGYAGSYDFVVKLNEGWSLTLETAEPDATVPGPGLTTANPYPMTRTVSGVEGVITDVDVTLDGVFHTRPDDLDVLLVGPGGQRVELMSDACGDTAANKTRWTWDDDALRKMLDDAECISGLRYQPTGFGEADQLPGPAPSRPYGNALAAFNETDPNGEWRLYIADDNVLGGAGFILDRFALDIKTRPKAKAAFGASVIDLAEGASGSLTVNRSGTAPRAGTVRVISAPASASAADFEPVSTTVDFAAGETRKTVPVRALSDDEIEPTETFAVALDSPTGDVALGTPQTAVVAVQDRTLRPATGKPNGDGPGGSGGPGGPDRVAPAITNVRLSPRTFTAGRRATVLRARRTGTKIRYTLSESASTALRIQRVARGRVAGGKCRLPTASNRRGRKCVRFVRAGTLRRSGKTGANRVAFSGRIGRRALRPGRYRLIVKATDASGNRSSGAPRAFRVKR
jgi:hypothetical protein